MRVTFFLFSVIALCLGFSGAALADLPRDWQLGMQEAASPVMEKFQEFHHFLLIVIVAIAIFVTLLLAYTCWRFSAKRNPVPSTTTHNTLLEIIWTGVPVLILMAVAVISLRSLYFAERIEKAEMTLKVIGYQWYWGYQYPDFNNLAFDSYLVPDKDLKSGQPRLLETDRHVVLPVDTVIRVQLTAADVIHSWAVPSLGVKKDAVPGRLNETWLKINKPGTYYGQCSELCGSGHGFMPITIDAVSKEEFAAWVKNR